MKTLVLATAGHVDHGKTTLVRALTGVETDRLAEEKRRGLTIELGRAYRELPDGRVLGIVDVPGHERFVGTMLSGVSGIDAALLVVAADDGPMPQTIEHLRILSLLGVRQSLVALTKTDLVDGHRVAEVTRQIQELLAASPLAEAPIFPISAATAAGVEPLETAIANLRTEDRSLDALFHLAIDRSFIAPGRGLVVTGTVSSGVIRVEDAVLLHRGAQPAHPARVRGIEVAGRGTDQASAGMRCALDLAGPDVDRGTVGRGDWVSDPAMTDVSDRLDVLLPPGTALSERRRDDMPVHFHIGAADRAGRLALLGDAAGDGQEGTWARVRLSEPVLAVTGDRFVLRDGSAQNTIGGGIVIDPFGPARGRAKPDRLAELGALAEADPRTALEGLAGFGPVGQGLFARRRGLPEAAVTTLLQTSPRLFAVPRAELIWLHQDWLSFLEECQAAVEAAHSAHPELAGMDRSAFLRALSVRPQPGLLDAALGYLTETGTLSHRHGVWAHPEHEPKLSDGDEAFWARIGPLLRSDGTPPPVVHELAKSLGQDPEVVGRHLVRIARAGRLVRIGRNRFVPPGDLDRLAAALPQMENGFTVADFRSTTGLGRNFTIEVLEYFDRAGITRREGDRRLIRPHTIAHSAT